MEALFDWLSKFFESLTVLGWAIFIISAVIYLFASATYVMRSGGTREAWFVVGIVGVFLGLGLRYGLPYATDLLSQGIRGSLLYVPDIQSSVREAFDMAGAPWGWDANGTPLPEPPATLVISEGDVTIISTSGPVVPTPVPTTPEAPTSTPSGVGGGDPPPTLTNEQAATAVINQQLTATYTPRPPTATMIPTLDMSIWNVQTPAPTRGPGG